MNKTLLVGFGIQAAQQSLEGVGHPRCSDTTLPDLQRKLPGCGVGWAEFIGTHGEAPGMPQSRCCGSEHWARPPPSAGTGAGSCIPCPLSEMLRGPWSSCIPFILISQGRYSRGGPRAPGSGARTQSKSLVGWWMLRYWSQAVHLWGAAVRSGVRA